MSDRPPRARAPQEQADSQALVEAARRLVENPDPSTRFVWIIAATHLLRQALEASLRRLWANKRVPDLGEASMRSQLIVLPYYLERTLAVQVAWAWSALSEAGHEREAARQPTLADLSSLILAVQALVDATA